MNEYVNIGKIVNTHGIKGELRIKSDFERKKDAFKVGNKIYISSNFQEEEITSYRVHKDFDMITLKGYSNINDVLSFLKLNVYIKREDLNLKANDYLMEDLIDFSIEEDNKILGKIVDFVYNSSNTLLVVEGTKKFYIPFVDDYIIKVDLINKKVITKNAKDLII